MNDQRRKKTRREIRLLQSESVWLQKALFALRKAEDAREKLADVRDQEVEPYTLAAGDGTLVVEEVEDALETRATELVKTVREMRRSLY
jgi:hypothetical protein